MPWNTETQQKCWVSEVPEAGVETSGFPQGNKALSESGGAPGGARRPDFDSAEDIRQKIVIDLTHGLVALTRLHTVVETRDAQDALMNEINNLKSILGSVEAILLDESGSDG